ncbi:hypothetical protein QQ008_02225 [Fulvivirgaceae bacterium BMA10]|uniref:Uncharacterized protein n=1 Tax=Splendidivirga corallicola TaxID=3051826 RepID=A0ABT8KHF3_9BACT|nr:hypothetical protein [Fulvivirgaceae bacterium BMA10]
MKGYLIIVVVLILFSCGDDPINDRFGLAVEEEILVSNVWKVGTFQDGSTNSAAVYNSVFIQFNDNNTFDLINEARNVYGGEWALTENNSLLVIRNHETTPDIYKDIGDEWVVAKINDQELRIIERDGDGQEEFTFLPATQIELSGICTALQKRFVDSLWTISYFSNNGADLTNSLRNYTFDFDDSGVLRAFNNNVADIGSWVTGIRCGKLRINLKNSSDLKPLSTKWKVIYSSPQLIKLVSERAEKNMEVHFSTQNAILLTDDEICLRSNEIIKNGYWRASKYIEGYDRPTVPFAGFILKFDRNDELIAISNTKKIVGEWNFIETCNKIAIHFSDTSLKEISGTTWHLTHLSDSLITLLVEDDIERREIHLVKQTDPQEKCNFLKQFLNDNFSWKVTKFDENGDLLTEEFSSSKIAFASDNSLKILSGNNVILGEWVLNDDCEAITISISEDQVSFSRLNAFWHITEFSEEQLVLVHEENDIRKEMVLTKN